MGWGHCFLKTNYNFGLGTFPLRNMAVRNINIEELLLVSVLKVPSFSTVFSISKVGRGFLG